MSYTPPDAVHSSLPHEIMALVGAPGSGKSTSMLTFPNRIYGDPDHKAPSGELSIPFWDTKWVDSMKMMKYHATDPANWRDAIKKWIRDELPKFSPEQTYMHDSWTEHIRMAAMQIRLEDSRQEKKNKFFFYQELKKYCEEVSTYIKNAPCRVVVSFHETPEWSEGEPTGKIKVVQDGQFKDQLFTIYTDVYRCINGIRSSRVDAGGKRVSMIIEGRYWQVQGDASFDCNANDTLAPLLRKHSIKYIETWITPDGVVHGGYQEIQRVYKEDNIKVENGILQRPLHTNV